MDFFLPLLSLPLLSWYITAQHSFVDIITARPVVELPVELPYDVMQQQQARELIDRLQLTPEQVEQLEAIEAQYQDQIDALTGIIVQRDIELSLLLAGDTTPEEARQQHSELTSLKQQLTDLMFNQALEIRLILTPTQRQQIVEMYGVSIQDQEPNP